jgi:uncharacterized membrane protein
MIALAFDLGYLLAGIPNVEAISAVSFFSGYLLGARSGTVVGAVSIFLFSVFNPFGMTFPAVLAAQTLGMALIGCSGRLWKRLATWVPRPELSAACFGAVLTLVYSVLADYGLAISMGRWREPLPVIAAGIPFSIIHIVSNALIFGAVGAFVVHKHKLRLGSRRI